MINRGRLIVLEGVDGVGKTTQAALLAQELERNGAPVTQVREPGGTPLGEHLREYLKSGEPLSREAELLLFAAARVQLVSEVIRPALKQGRTVVADRFAPSTLAYQGDGLGIHPKDVKDVNALALDGLRPDLCLLLDLDPERALARIPERDRRFESRSMRFHRRVRRSYLGQAAGDPGWEVIDASNSPEEVEQQVWQAMIKRLGEPGTWK